MIRTYFGYIHCLCDISARTEQHNGSEIFCYKHFKNKINVCYASIDLLTSYKSHKHNLFNIYLKMSLHEYNCAYNK